MTEFTSEIKTIPYTCGEVYSVLSDLRNLEKVQDKIPQHKPQSFSCSVDSCTMSISPVGEVKFNIIEREPSSTIKFEAEKIPFALTMWIQLKESGGQETKMKLTVKADLNVFIKPMVSKPLQEAVDKIAGMLAIIPYDQINE